MQGGVKRLKQTVCCVNTGKKQVKQIPDSLAMEASLDEEKLVYMQVTPDHLFYWQSFPSEHVHLHSEQSL